MNTTSTGHLAMFQTDTALELTQATAAIPSAPGAYYEARSTYGQTFARVSYDIPGQEQRFARLRGLRDAENRAAKVIADNVRTRLASYFAAGT